jgi:protein tyrosine phosphatase (PTP) superfamily phosphohydrolase (DUF442 family)
MTDNPYDTISWITESLGLSSGVPAQDPRTIRQNGIKTIVSIGERKAAEGDGWEVVRFPDIAADGSDPDDRISEVIAAIGSALARGKTLVHCQAGSSRSAGMVVLYLAAKLGMDWPTALTVVQERRPVVNVSSSLEKSLRRWERRQRAGP